MLHLLQHVTKSNPSQAQQGLLFTLIIPSPFSWRALPANTMAPCLTAASGPRPVAGMLWQPRCATS